MGRTRHASGTAWFTQSVLVALVSRRRLRSGRVKGMAFVGVLKRVWIPLVILAVIDCGGFIVSRVRANFASEKHASYANSPSADTGQFNPKSMVYGPVGIVADISYFDVDSDPQRVGGARSPCSLEITASVPAVAGNIVAQGDSNSIGCRIVVDGQVKAERVSNEVNAYTRWPG
jgi:Mycobacterium membrane protein